MNDNQLAFNVNQGLAYFFYRGKPYASPRLSLSIRRLRVGGPFGKDVYIYYLRITKTTSGY